MQRARQRSSARASGRGLAREIDIPLPTKGIMAEAETAEISGLYAAELTNWRSTGASLRTRLPFSPDSTGEMAFQRIPFEFEATSAYISLVPNQIKIGSINRVKNYHRPMDVAYMSSNAILADGITDPLLFDGAAFTVPTFTTDTGLEGDSFDGVVAHNDRLYWWRTGDGIDFYYSDTVGGISGLFKRYPLGRLGNITGAILCIKSLTVDAGNNTNDVLAVFTTTGYIIAYEGLDPDDAGNWRMLTRIKAAPPISKRAFVEVGSDLWMLTAGGVVSVVETLQKSRLALATSVSKPIHDRLVEQVSAGGEWSMHMSANSDQVIVNRVTEMGDANQFIYRTDNGAWTEADYPANHWHNLGLKTQFTSSENGVLCTVGTGSEQIQATWVSGWFRLPRSGAITYLKPTIIARGPLTVSVTVLSDHDETSADVAEAVQTVTLLPDEDGGRVSLNEQIAVDAVGEVFQIRLEVTAEWAEIVNLKAAVL